MSDTVSAELARIKGLAEGATDGPWFVEHGRIWWRDVKAAEPVQIVSLSGSRPWAPNAALIVDARTTVPRLVAALEAVLALHRPVEVSVVDALDCIAEECEHDGDCPATGRLTICAECDERCSEGYAYYAERGIGAAAYPCPTARAITDALTSGEDAS